MSGRSSTFGGLLGNVLLFGFGIYMGYLIVEGIIAPIVRFLMPGVEL